MRYITLKRSKSFIFICTKIHFFQFTYNTIFQLNIQIYGKPFYFFLCFFNLPIEVDIVDLGGNQTLDPRVVGLIPTQANKIFPWMCPMKNSLLEFFSMLWYPIAFCLNLWKVGISFKHLLLYKYCFVIRQTILTESIGFFVTLLKMICSNEKSCVVRHSYHYITLIVWWMGVHYELFCATLCTHSVLLVIHSLGYILMI